MSVDPIGIFLHCYWYFHNTTSISKQQCPSIDVFSPVTWCIYGDSGSFDSKKGFIKNPLLI